ncbi:2'-5' RNA ligase family protein [Phenylobacterium deserti]|uniref:2'-5' RNA ligase family protein n=1 Tax=Phenylobacterium deserti TaxID=1914756 RepID=UPI001403F925|nr:2'-5' RNA ligase family protein [Phenylobacterium deserti]
MSALVLVVPEVETLLADIRAEHDPAAKLGMPPHVTVLYPFASPKRLGPTERMALAELILGFPAMDLSFQRTARFPDVLWLAPEPVEPVLALADGLTAAFPKYPPYRGKFTTVIPHLTVAQAPAPVLDQLEPIVRARFAEPVRARADAVALFTTVEKRWVEVDRFRLG